jgi:hypothetical protein
MMIGSAVDPFPYFVASFQLNEVNGNFKLEPSKVYGFEVLAYDVYGVSVSSSVGNARENGGVPPTGRSPAPYEPTRKFCIRSDPTNTISVTLPSNGFSGTGGTICGPWGSVINATGRADRPDTVIRARFSLDPRLSVASDPLSAATADWTLIFLQVVLQPSCLSRPRVFTAPNQSCTETWQDNPNDQFPGIPANSIILVPSNPAIVSARLEIIDATTFRVIYTSGQVAGSAYVRMFSSSAYLYTADFINRF